MNRRTQSDKQSMTPLQRQAVLVCVVCGLAALLTIGITLTLLKRGKAETPTIPDASSTTEPAEDDGDLSDHYQIDDTSAALLTETADAGQSYQDEMLFIGDSNTVRLYNNGLISLQQFCAKEGIGTQVALNEGIVTFKKDTNTYTIAQAVAMMKPRRVLITLGTNDNGMDTEAFIGNYTALIQAIQASYPYTDIIVNTVPPIPADHSTYPHMDQAKIDDFNMALLSMCEQLGVRFLNSAEVLKGEDGYGIADYYTSGDIHLKSAGLKAVLNYLRTHAYETEDRRPDTNNIPTRTLEYVSNPSSAVQAPSSEAASESASSSSEAEAVHYEARYQVEKSGGGTLTSGSDSGKTTLTYAVTDASQTVTVTAVPAEGHVFVKWSDGETNRTRTDSKFKQNLDVTAVFAAVSVEISSEGKGLFGNSYIFKAKLSGKYASSDNLRWYANGEEVKAAAGQTTVTVPASSVTNGSYKIYAVVTYNDCKVTSNTLTLTVTGEAASSSSSSSSSGSSSSGSTSSSSQEKTESNFSSSSGSSSSSSSSSSSHSTSSSSEHSSSSASSASESKSTSESESKSESKSESDSKSESKSESASESKAESKSEASSKSESSSSSDAENDLPASSETTEESASR